MLHNLESNSSDLPSLSVVVLDENNRRIFLGRDNNWQEDGSGKILKENIKIWKDLEN